MLVVLLGAAFAVGRSTIDTDVSATKGAKRIAVVTGSSTTATTSTTVSDIPGATRTIVIPPSTTGLLLARFSGQSDCTGSTAGSLCLVRLMYQKNGAGQFLPLVDAPGWKTFDSSEASSGGRESHATEWVSGSLGPGSYEIKAQWSVQASGMTFDIDFWTLVAEWWRTT